MSQGSLAVWGVFSILIARALPDQAFAAFTLARTISMFAGLIGGGFVLQSLLKLGSEKPSRETSRLANTASLMAICFSVVMAVLLLLFSGVLDSFYSEIDLSRIMPMVVLTAFTGTLSGVPRNILLTRFGTSRVMTADLVSLLIKGGAVGWLILSGTLTSAVQVLLASSAANVAAFAVNGWNARKYVDFSAGVGREALGRVVSFAVFSLGTSLAGFVYTRTDVLMLGKLAPPEDVAAYGASRSLTGMITMISAAANMVLMPYISRAWSEGRYRLLMKKNIQAILYVQLIQLPVVLALVLAPKWIIDTVYEGKYTEFWPILAILGVTAVFRPFGSLFSTMGSAMGKPQYSFWAILISAVVNVIFNIILIPSMGGTGAALATGTAVFAGAAAIVILTVGRWRREKEER